MKRQIIIGTILAATLATGVSFASATPPGGPAPDKSCDMHGERGPGAKHFLNRMAKELGLTADQKKQIGAILKAEQEQNAPTLKKLAEGRRQLDQAAEAATFDEAAVKALAANQAALMQEMMVSRARTRNQIHALLTPEQRDKAAKLREKMKHRRPHRRHEVEEG